jgi:hypothetical protein
MKTTLRVFCLLVVAGAATRALALAGDLKEPGLAFPQGFSESSRERIMGALKRDDCRFLGGNFVNSATSLRYGGDSRALSLFLEGLAKCPGISVSISFQAEPFQEACDWEVEHSAHAASHVTVRVNLKSPGLKLEDLRIPEVKGPPVEAEK